MNKTCTKCHKEKPATTEYFSLNKENKDRLDSWCKKCQNKRRRAYHRTEKGKTANRKAELKSVYNMTLEQYDRMFKTQNGVCAICGGINIDGRRLAVDHNHKTGKIRGLLCTGCNMWLGCFEKNRELFKKFVVYLKTG